jgi:hypothetical protein
MMDIVIETEADSNLIAKLPDATPLAAKQFVGGPDLVHVLLSLTAATLPLIGKAILEEIRSRRHVRLVIKGGKSSPNLDLRGVSGDQAAEIVNKYLEELLRTAPKEK